MRAVFLSVTSSRLSLALTLGVLTALVAIPWFTGFGTQRLLVEVFTVFAIAMAWNLLAGFGGMVVVGLHVFVGVGAYALFFLSNILHWNPWATLPLAVAVTGLFAALVAMPMFRLNGAHFAVGTWVLAELMRILVLNNDALGSGGGMPLSTLTNFNRIERNTGTYWAALAVAIIALFWARGLIKSSLGLALASIRDSEPAARASGVPVMRTKLALWLMCACLTGLAGAVAYMNTLQVSPDASFGLSWTAMAIFISVLGGIGRIEGPVIGTAIFFLLREFSADYGVWYFVALGVIAIVTMLLSPQGAWGLLQRRWPALDPLQTRRLMP